MRTLHFDCFAGISGDMALGAFADLGVDQDRLRAELGKLGLHGWKLEFRRDERCGISGTRAVVELESDDHHAHDDDHHHAHDHQGGHDHDHHDHEHHREHDHEHHSHNSWRDIRALIEGAGLSAGAEKRSLDIFSRIAAAEAQVHGVPVDDIAFHEVGALDSIIDIVGTAVCLDLLQPDRVTASEIELGGGTVKCAHGVLPVPAPATLLLIAGLPVKTGGFQKEMTTPTGAAILASCVDEFVSGASFTELRTGYGVGTRKLDKPNVLRVSWREEASPAGGNSAPWETEELVLIEANIDDMTGEAFAFLSEKLFESGALDVTLAPCVMKKSRPGTIVSVLCPPGRLDSLRRAVFTHSTTLGFRECAVRRLSLKREESRLSGSLGDVRTKTAFLGGRALRSKVEFDDRARVARERGCSLDEAERLIQGETGLR